MDEKIQSLNESPTNSIGGVYALNQPGFRLSRELDPPKVFYPDVDGNWPAGIPGTPGEPNYVRPAGYWDEGPGTTAANPYDTLYTADWSYSVQEDNPRNTETLIDPDTGYVRSELPPNSRSFILGPLVDLYFHNHSNDNRTYVGYVQKDTREFVLLGYVNGRWGNDDDGNLIYQDGFTSGRIWNGEQSGFTASNSNFTFEMLQWFHNKLKAGRYVKNASFFNSGGVPIVSGGGGTGQPSGTTQGNAVGAGGPADAGNNGNANTGAGTGGNPNIGTPQDPANHGGPEDDPRPYEPLENQAVPHDIYGDLLLLGLSAAAAFALAKALAAGSAAALAQAKRIAQAAKNWWNKGRNTRIPDENNASWRDLMRDDLAQRGQSDASFQAGKPPRGIGRPDQAFNPFRPASKGGPGSGPTPAVRQAFERPFRWFLGQSYEMDGNFITEEVGDDIIDAIDVALKETETLGEFLKVLDVIIALIEKRQSNVKKQVKESREVLTESRKRILREIKQPYKMKETPKQKYKMNFKGKFTAQNTPDVTASKKSDEVVTAKNAAGQTWRTQDKYWSGYESTERMNVIYDHVGHGQIYWDTIVNENRHKKNMRDREIQEHLNLIEHKKAMKEIIEQQTLDAPKDPLFKKVAKRLKTEIDYPDKPSKNGYPDTPPPEMVNGFHPKYGKTHKYDKLDPHSAEAMPPTGNPEIDANVQKAKRLKKILGKRG